MCHLLKKMLPWYAAMLNNIVLWSTKGTNVTEAQRKILHIVQNNATIPTKDEKKFCNWVLLEINGGYNRQLQHCIKAVTSTTPARGYWMASTLHLNNPNGTQIHACSTTTFQEWRLLFHQLNLNVLIYNTQKHKSKQAYFLHNYDWNFAFHGISDWRRQQCDYVDINGYD